jgi:hypothetical protein
LPPQENFAATLELGVTQAPPPVIEGADPVVDRPRFFGPNQIGRLRRLWRG